MEARFRVWSGGELLLLCPSCGDEVTHITHAGTASRQEDGDFTYSQVNLVTGLITVPAAVPASSWLGEGRRSRVALIGYCEVCTAEFAIVFTQHKGTTFIDAVPVAIDHESVSGLVH